MTRLVMCFSILVGFFSGCVPSNHSNNVGNYYLYYKDGKVLSENDSLTQVYIRLYGDGTYIIKAAQSVERGRWKNIDYDDFSITYFYPTYLNYLFGIGAIGETMIGFAPRDPNTKVFSGSNWYGAGKLADDSFDQILFCQQDKVLIKEDLNDILGRIYGSNLKKRPTANL